MRRHIPSSQFPRRTMTATSLRRLRDALGVTQGELADYLGYTKRMIQRWETGEHAIPAVIAIALSQPYAQAALKDIARRRPLSGRQGPRQRRTDKPA